MADADLKDAVREFWDEASCGEVYAQGDTLLDQFEAHRRTRYALEPYLQGFARFPAARGKDVLEIGVGMGADHVELARNRPRSLVGIDVSPRAVDWTQRRLETYGFVPNVRTGDAESLPFDDESFDIVYSWGVLHHTPDTRAAFNEVHRVLRAGGEARVMIYHRPSVVGALLWSRYGLLAGRPFRSMTDIYASHLESPGTKAYTVREAQALVQAFARARIDVQLSLGDLIEGEVGQRHSGAALTATKRLWPRPLIQRVGQRFGLFLLLDLTK